MKLPPSCCRRAAKFRWSEGGSLSCWRAEIMFLRQELKPAGNIKTLTFLFTGPKLPLHLRNELIITTETKSHTHTLTQFFKLLPIIPSNASCLSVRLCEDVRFTMLRWLCCRAEVVETHLDSSIVSDVSVAFSKQLQSPVSKQRGRTTVWRLKQSVRSSWSRFRPKSFSVGFYNLFLLC